jgi:hypothetical protein
VDKSSSLLESHRLALDSLADLLCEHETVDGAQIDVILGEEKKPEEGKIFPGSAPNGHKPFQVVAGIKDDG